MPHKWNAEMLEPGEQTPWACGSYRAHMQTVAQAICSPKVTYQDLEVTE